MPDPTNVPHPADRRFDLDHRFNYHAPKGNQADRYNAIRTSIRETAKLIVRLTPVSAEQTRAMNALDEAMFLANASIARNETEGNGPTP
jgi:hypothetical protein